jgi:hypothetical protein
MRFVARVPGNLDKSSITLDPAQAFQELALLSTDWRYLVSTRHILPTYWSMKSIDDTACAVHSSRTTEGRSEGPVR